jgi:hypothetical protein
MGKRIIVALALGALLIASLALPAGAKQRRRVVVEGTYNGPAGVWAFQGDAGFGALACATANSGCLEFEVPSGATHVTIEIADSTGQNPVALLSGVGPEGVIETCDATTGPVELEDLSKAQEEGTYDPADGPPSVGVTVASGLCPDGSPGLATSGTVTATFSTGT